MLSISSENSSESSFPRRIKSISFSRVSDEISTGAASAILGRVAKVLINEIPFSLKILKMQGFARGFQENFLDLQIISVNLSMMLDVHRVNFPA